MTTKEEVGALLDVVEARAAQKNLTVQFHAGKSVGDYKFVDREATDTFLDWDTEKLLGQCVTERL